MITTLTMPTNVQTAKRWALRGLLGMTTWISLGAGSSQAQTYVMHGPQPLANPSTAPEVAAAIVVPTYPAIAFNDLSFTVSAIREAPIQSQLDTQEKGIMDLDVDTMLHRPLNGSRAFSQLKVDRNFFNSATEAATYRLQQGDGEAYLWATETFQWHSPVFCYSPLYFEQPNYERYGHGIGKPLAPVVSASRFVGQVTTLPLAIFCTPPWTKSCTLGHRRPGDCAPYQHKTSQH